jgi:hypothetical protein
MADDSTAAREQKRAVPSHMSGTGLGSLQMVDLVIDPPRYLDGGDAHGGADADSANVAISDQGA